ncbi:Small primase-like proteins (Toprim domain) [Archaeoglobus sulfaticallidus PM70-1]|uniref:Small primase-like proteins (Toprim domain) n=1 Tax=Archaeoglobus sulfaticallidus PM70-1 TaxID=387631 RepID=N0BKN4_9EURY|nr:toprim domain-containing protein [Archaeoglobus sulfaticallidus]AGK60770.1 Small primase-like proteins (Toprim domain) [Archaeoglobus sulfaticallidus PM70-1]
MKLSYEELVEIREIIKEIARACDDGAVIIVEGRSDEKALKEMGIHGEVRFASISSDAEIVDSVRSRFVILLTDWDYRGNKIEKELSRKLELNGIAVDREYRKRLFRIVGKEVRTIEDIPKLIKKAEIELEWQGYI